MSVDKFKFVSPGVFIDEIDESGIPSSPVRMGPVVVGRFQKGPSNRPIRVNSYKEFTQIFGDPAPGNASGDIFRTGEMTAPTYAAYAVKAWLRNNSPCTVYRVLGENATDAADTQAAQAGWKTTNTHNAALASNGGAFGLAVFPSASYTTNVTGTIAAIWYMEEGGIILTGTRRAGEDQSGSLADEGAGLLFNSTNQEFTAKIKNATGAVVKTATFNFDRDSEKFIRKVFNTDPTKTNSDLINTTTTTQLTYWLGETFESNLRSAENSKLKITGLRAEGDPPAAPISNTADTYAAIVALKGATIGSWEKHQQNSRAAQTGWFFSQDTRGDTTANFSPLSDTQKLFKFHALDSGEQANREYKVSISDIKIPTDNFNKFGSFSLQVRKAGDTDNNPIVLEQYSGVNLNPKSSNYIGRAIGTRYYTYDETNKRIVDHGEYDNVSSILRVEVHPVVVDGNGEGLNPYGVFGPSVPKNQTITGESLNTAAIIAAGSGSIPVELLTNDPGTGATAVSRISAGHVLYTGLRPLNGGPSEFTSSLEWPTTRMRVSSSEGGLVIANRCYWGYQANVKGTKRFDNTNLDLLRGQPATADPTAVNNAYQQYSWAFTLDDIKESPGTGHSVHVSGSRAAGTSWTAVSGSTFILTGSGAGFKRFTSPMFGGFDGFDITEKDPLRNSKIAESPTVKNDTIFYSLKKAVDVISDPDYLEFDLAAIPGVTNTSINAQLINACEERADALAVIDLEGGYTPRSENNNEEADNIGSVELTVKKLKDLNINSSYGCAFYPWVKIRDNAANSSLYVPPSVVAMGTFSSAQRKSAVWFAPAGFTRGGLSEGSAGVPVVGVRQRVTSAERDRLYDANINPIASFPAEGIVIFGQKTLQVTASSLDRINVRRLLIYLKKEVSRIASRVLFDQNVQQTWDRFTGQVIPFLEGVQAGLGLTDFKVLLDDTTTTPDLVDRNILYAKIFLKPARAVEFIALDFIITRSGASFDD